MLRDAYTVQPPRARAIHTRHCAPPYAHAARPISRRDPGSPARRPAHHARSHRRQPPALACCAAPRASPRRHQFVDLHRPPLRETAAGSARARLFFGLIDERRRHRPPSSSRAGCAVARHFRRPRCLARHKGLAHEVLRGARSRRSHRAAATARWSALAARPLPSLATAPPPLDAAPRPALERRHAPRSSSASPAAAAPSHRCSARRQRRRGARSYATQVMHERRRLEEERPRRRRRCDRTRLRSRGAATTT